LAFWELGTVIGVTLEVDMLTYRKKGVIRVRVGMLDKRRLPLTTDLVFGIEGYNITFTLVMARGDLLRKTQNQQQKN
jgi:hypothetical protein